MLYLIGWGHRIGTLYHWAWSLLLTRNRGQRLITVQRVHDQLVHPALTRADLPDSRAGAPDDHR